MLPKPWPLNSRSLLVGAVILALTAACLQAAEPVANPWLPFGPFGGSVQVVATDPHRPQIVLVGARGGLLFRSIDGAKTWTKLSFGINLTGNVRTLTIDPQNSQHYWAGMAGESNMQTGLWESDDAGAYWRQVPELAGLSVESFAAMNAKTAVAGTRHGIYRTLNGKNWARISPTGNPELQDITAIAFGANNPAIIYAGTPHLPWKTSTGGAHWQSVRAGMIDDSDVFSLFVDPARPQRIFASACSGIYRSENAGGTWTLLDGIPGTSRRTHVIVQDPRRPLVMYAGTTLGLFKSWNGGLRWNHLNTAQINSIAFDPTDSRILYLATEQSGVLLSRDGGATSAPANLGLLSRNLGGLAITRDRIYLSTVYEGAEGGVFMSSITKGAMQPWQRIGTPVDFGGSNVTSLAAESETLYAAAGNRVYRFTNTNGGAQPASRWTELPPPTGDGNEVHWLHLLPGGALLAVTNKGLRQLPPGSTQWEAVSLVGISAPVQAIHAGAGFMAATTQAGLYVSNNFPKDWQALQNLSLPDGAGAVYAVAHSCSNVMLVAASHGLFRGDLARKSVFTPTAGIPPGTVNTVAFHPIRCDEAYAAQFGSTYVSHDGGSTWAALSRVEVGTNTIDRLWVLPTLPRVLFSAQPGQGVFYQDLGN